MTTTARFAPKAWFFSLLGRKTSHGLVRSMAARHVESVWNHVRERSAELSAPARMGYIRVRARSILHPVLTSFLRENGIGIDAEWFVDAVVDGMLPVLVHRTDGRMQTSARRAA